MSGMIKLKLKGVKLTNSKKDKSIKSWLKIAEATLEEIYLDAIHEHYLELMSFGTSCLEDHIHKQLKKRGYK